MYKTSPENSGVGVPMTTLDSYFGETRVAACKVDVEGAEGRVLAGMRQILARDHPALVIEFHGGEGATVAAGILREHGYEIFDLRTSTLIGDSLPAYFHGLARVRSVG